MEKNGIRKFFRSPEVWSKSRSIVEKILLKKKFLVQVHSEKISLLKKNSQVQGHSGKKWN